jgi:hypothetical protein
VRRGANVLCSCAVPLCCVAVPTLTLNRAVLCCAVLCCAGRCARRRKTGAPLCHCLPLCCAAVLCCVAVSTPTLNRALLCWSVCQEAQDWCAARMRRTEIPTGAAVFAAQHHCPTPQALD